MFLLVLFCSLDSRAAKGIAYDTLPQPIAKVDKEVEESVFADKDYVYEKEQGSASGFMGNFFEWLIRKLFGDYSDASVSAFWNVLKYILIVLFILGIAYFIAKSNGRSLFRGDSSRTSIFKDLDEDIEKLDIDKLIRDAVAASDYKLAFRYTFLKSLQLMNSKALIDWMPYKTNYEYYTEFKAERIRPLFKDLYVGFEYVWYGDADINKEVFEKYTNEFNSFNKQIGV